MSKEDLVEAIKAADVGPFREVRLITLVHHQGVTPAVIGQVVSELKEVNTQELAEVNELKELISSLEPELETIKELKKVAGKVAALKK